MAARMDSENMRWTTMAIRIQREVGGNLAETLRTTAATLREREMLKRQVQDAVGGGQALGLHPHRAADRRAALQHDDATTTTSACCGPPLLGIVMSVAGLIAMAIGICWMRKVVKIEV